MIGAKSMKFDFLRAPNLSPKDKNESVRSVLTVEFKGHYVRQNMKYNCRQRIVGQQTLIV